MKVLVVGLQGDQETRLRQRLPRGVTVSVLSPERSLGLRKTDADIVIVTRFVNHKHEQHLRKVATRPVYFVRHGLIDAIIKLIESQIALRTT